jgi:REP element-mobilizing transposase RayT
MRAALNNKYCLYKINMQEEQVPQSLANVSIHLVFSTKHRERLIEKPVLPALHAYMVGVLAGIGCPVIRIGGVQDHVHVLCRLPRTRSVAELVETLKGTSSRWMRARRTPDASSQWQSGYGAFAVSQSQVPVVGRYIERQEQHHETVDFQSEHRALLRRHGVEWQEEYVWD